MFNIGYDILVVDDEFVQAGADLASMAEAFETKLQAYYDCLGRVVSGAVKEGDVAQNLVTFQQSGK